MTQRSNGTFPFSFCFIFPCSAVGKESAFTAVDLGSIPGSGRSPGKGNGNPLQYSCLENSTDRGAWHGIARVSHNLTTKPKLVFSAKNLCFFFFFFKFILSSAFVSMLINSGRKHCPFENTPFLGGRKCHIFPFNQKLICFFLYVRAFKSFILLNTFWSYYSLSLVKMFTWELKCTNSYSYIQYNF